MQHVALSSWVDTRSFLISLDFYQALEAPRHTGAPQQPSCLTEPQLYDPCCPICLVDGPAARSQVCRPPESLLMEMRFFPCCMPRSLGDLPGFLPLCSRVGGGCWTVALPLTLSGMLAEVLSMPFPFVSWSPSFLHPAVSTPGSGQPMHPQCCKEEAWPEQMHRYAAVACPVWAASSVNAGREYTFFWCSWNVSILVFLGHLSLLDFAGNGTLTDFLVKLAMHICVTANWGHKMFYFAYV